MELERIENRLKRFEPPRLETKRNLKLMDSDTFIFCNGFEDRATTAPKMVMKDSLGAKASFIEIDYLPKVAANDDLKLLLTVAASGFHCSTVTYDRADPAGFGELLIESLPPLDGRIYIDISAMSRLLVVQTIVALLNSEYLQDRGISIIYTEAEEYRPMLKDVEEELANRGEPNHYASMFLSEGVNEVVVIPELTSVAMFGQPVRLVAFPSFNVSQLSALVMELQPSSTSYIHGVTPATENRWRETAIKDLNRVEIKSGDEECYVSTLHYQETVACLVDLYNRHSSVDRIVIAPTGSKMQTVGVAIFRAFMEDVQVVYPVPRTFASPRDYTVGARAVFQLDLDAYGKLRLDYTASCSHGSFS